MRDTVKVEVVKLDKIRFLYTGCTDQTSSKRISYKDVNMKSTLLCM